MTDASKEDMARFVGAAERLAEAIQKLPTGSSSGNTMTVHVGVGPVCAGVMFGMCLILAFVLFRQDERIDALQDYLNVILINTPEKPNVTNHPTDLKEAQAAAQAHAETNAETNAEAQEEVTP